MNRSRAPIGRCFVASLLILAGHTSWAANDSAKTLLLVQSAKAPPAPSRWAEMTNDGLALIEATVINVLACATITEAATSPHGLFARAGRPAGTDAGVRAPLYAATRISPAFTMASALSYLYQARHPRGRLTLPMWITTHALAATNAVARTVAGSASWGDVAIGAAVGTAIGLAVPALRRARNRAPQEQPGLALVGIRPAYYGETGLGMKAKFAW